MFWEFSQNNAQRDGKRRLPPFDDTNEKRDASPPKARRFRRISRFIFFLIFKNNKKAGIRPLQFLHKL